MINKNVVITKKSKLEIHKDLQNELTVPNLINTTIEKYFKYYENFTLLWYMYGMESQQFNAYNESMNKKGGAEKWQKKIENYFSTYWDRKNILSNLKAYYVFKPDPDLVNIKMEDFILKDLNDLNKEQIGYLFYNIKSNSNLENIIILQFHLFFNSGKPTHLDKELLNFLINNKEYIRLKRPFEIDAILV